MSQNPSSHERQIKTAVIPIAGLGTRMWPYTAGSPKFMAPIYVGTKAIPNIDFTLDDCIAAGIENLVFITSNGGEDALKKYLGPIDPDVAARYLSADKAKEFEKELARRDAFKGMNIEYIDQPVGKYGTAIPLNLARPALQGVKHFAVTGGDDFIWSPDGISELDLQIKSWRQSGHMGSIMGKSVSREQATRYGILLRDDDGLLTGIAEKPPLEAVPPEPLANISRYILSEDIWPQLEAVLAQPHNPAQPEYYITDVIDLAIGSGQTFDVHTVQGRYFDAGSAQGALEASRVITNILTNG